MIIVEKNEEIMRMVVSFDYEESMILLCFCYSRGDFTSGVEERENIYIPT